MLGFNRRGGRSRFECGHRRRRFGDFDRFGFDPHSLRRGGPMRRDRPHRDPNRTLHHPHQYGASQGPRQHKQNNIDPPHPLVSFYLFSTDASGLKSVTQSENPLELK
jgi:hypothetical protein